MPFGYRIWVALSGMWYGKSIVICTERTIFRGSLYQPIGLFVDCLSSIYNSGPLYSGKTTKVRDFTYDRDRGSDGNTVWLWNVHVLSYAASFCVYRRKCNGGDDSGIYTYGQRL